MIIISSDEDDEPLPPGWKIKNRTDGVEIIQTFISPEGKEFPVCKLFIIIRGKKFIIRVTV